MNPQCIITANTFFLIHGRSCLLEPPLHYLSKLYSAILLSSCFTGSAKASPNTPCVYYLIGLPLSFIHWHRLPHKGTVTHLLMEKTTLTCQQDCDLPGRRQKPQDSVPWHLAHHYLVIWLHI